MRKPNSKLSELVPHPLPSAAQRGTMVTRRFAREWVRSDEAIHARRERARVINQVTPELTALEGWAEVVATVAAERGLTPEAIMAEFAAYDARIADGWHGTVPPMDLGDTFELDGVDRETGKPYTKELATDLTDAERAREWVEFVLTLPHRQPPRTPVKLPRRRRTKEAIRKATARAEGRVKPRPKKGPPTTAAKLAAREASLVTRRAKLADLKADPRWYAISMGDVMRCEAGIKSTEKAIATLRAKLKAEAEPA